MSKKRRAETDNKRNTESGFEKFGRVVGTIFNVSIVLFKLFVFLFLILIIFSFLGLMVPEDIERGNVAVIPITGMISTNSETSFTATANSEAIVKLIEKADEKEGIGAIILEIDSPGGAPVASDEIATAVKRAAKPTVAVIRETGASGAYWIASAADKIYANRMSITGSIGVRASRVEIAGLMDDYNVTYRRLVAGKYKDAGTMLKTMTPEEEKLFQTLLDELHTDFINTVAQNRNMPEEKIRELATGFVFLGSDAKELGLVDELGGRKEALDYLGSMLNITAKPVMYKTRGTFFDELAGISSEGFFNIGKGIGSVFAEQDAQISLT